MGDFESRLFDFLILSLWHCFRKCWPLLFLTPILFVCLSKGKIEEIPTRYQVVGVVKMGFLSVRSFKSAILEKISDVTKRAPIEEAMGLQKEDLNVVLNARFINHRGKNKNMWDKGPFLTSIEFPEKSSLVIIKAEAQNRDDGVKSVKEVISFLEIKFSKNKRIFVETIMKRVSTLQEDYSRVSVALGKIDKVEKEFGFTPLLSNQRNELIVHEALLRYMILDVKGQLDSTSIKNFEIISLTEGVYPVTKRKIIFYISAAAVGGIFGAIMIFAVSIFYYRFVPPPIPHKLIAKDA